MAVEAKVADRLSDCGEKISVISRLRDPWLAVMLVSALVIRAAAAIVLGNEVSGISGAHDEISYSMLGQRFAGGYGLTFPQAWYPWIAAGAPQSYYSATMSLGLGVVYMVVGYYPVLARLLMALLSVAVVALIYLLAQRIFTLRVARLAAGIGVGYAYLVFYGVTLVTETPFMVAVLSAIYVAYDIRMEPSRNKWLLMGLCLAIAVLVRMAVVFYVPFLIGWVLAARRDEWRNAVVPGVVIVLAVLPFTVRNYQLWGKFLVLEAQFGHVFWNGNHPAHAGDYHPYRVFPIPDDVLVTANDVEITNRLLSMGMENVRRDPGHFTMLTAGRMRELFTFWPTRDSTWAANVLRVLSFGIVFPLSWLGLWSARRRWRNALPLFCFVALHVAVYASSWAMIRYRVPLDPVFIIFAACGVNRIAAAIQQIRLPIPVLRAAAWVGLPVSRVWRLNGTG